jgi:hypothetical protein
MTSRTPVGAEPALDDGGRVGILPLEDAGNALDDRHPAPERQERLRQLAADRAGADDHEARGPLRQREDGLVGEVARLLDARDRRRRRARAGGDRRRA